MAQEMHHGWYKGLNIDCLRPLSLTVVAQFSPLPQTTSWRGKGHGLRIEATSTWFLFISAYDSFPDRDNNTLPAIFSAPIHEAPASSQRCPRRCVFRK